MSCSFAAVSGGIIRSAVVNGQLPVLIKLHHNPQLILVDMEVEVVKMGKASGKCRRVVVTRGSVRRTRVVVKSLDKQPSRVVGGSLELRLTGVMCVE